MKQSSLYTILFLVVTLSYAGCRGISDPQRSPEAIARAYIEAVAEGNCKVVERYIAPDYRGELEFDCGENAIFPLILAEIDEVKVRDAQWWGDKEVTVLSNFERDSSTKAGSPLPPLSEQTVYVEEIDGKWK